MKPTVVAVHLCVCALLLSASPRDAHTQPAFDQERKSDSSRAAFMKHHFALVSSVHDALVKGDLDTARRHAKVLASAEHPRGLPEAATPYLKVMHHAAGRAASADDLEDGASATAAMLAACGDCHRAVGTMPVVPPPATAPVGGLVGHMLRHGRAMELLAQGLIVPSTTAWQEGAAALDAAPLRKGELPRDPKLTREILHVEERIHELAERARESSETRGRIYVYSELLESCATCHSLHGKVWGPEAR